MATVATTRFKHLWPSAICNRKCVVVIFFLRIYAQKTGMLESELHNYVKNLKS